MLDFSLRGVSTHDGLPDIARPQRIVGSLGPWLVMADRCLLQPSVASMLAPPAVASSETSYRV